MVEYGEQGRAVSVRPLALEDQLATLQQGVAEVRATQQQLVESLNALCQEQAAQRDLLTKLERELRRGRWWRWFWIWVRLLIWAALIGAVLYYFADWEALFQIFV